MGRCPLGVEAADRLRRALRRGNPLDGGNRVKSKTVELFELIFELSGLVAEVVKLRTKWLAIHYCANSIRKGVAYGGGRFKRQLFVYCFVEPILKEKARALAIEFETKPQLGAIIAAIEMGVYKRRIQRFVECGDWSEGSTKLVGPPVFAEFLITLFTRSEHAGGLLQCLDEKFSRDCDAVGYDRARWCYWGKVLHSLWPLLQRATARAVKWTAILSALSRLMG
jgi:hypothetical protein